VRTDELDFDLPEELIARSPATPRDSARLMVVSRSDDSVLHHARVRDLPSFLSPGDTMVFNTTRVIPARFAGVNLDTGGKVTGLYIEDGANANEWRVLLKMRRHRPGVRVRLGDEADGVVLELIERDSDDGVWRVRVEAKAGGLDRVGLVPLPPYILSARRHAGEAENRDEDAARYQTVYADEPGSSGLKTATVASVTRMAELGARHGFQVCVHAIGDRANREVLDIYEKVWGRKHDGAKLRWRIEHAQHLHRDDIPRFGKLGVIASMQGVHCISDAPYVLLRLGEQRAREGAYVWQSLLKSGAVVTNGTDAPVEDVDPIESYYATVTRKGKSGTAFYPDQAMSRMAALRSYTIAGAYAAFEEDIKGSLTPGKLADVVVLSKDILTVPEEEIRDTQVLYTIVGGKVVYDASK